MYVRTTVLWLYEPGRHRAIPVRPLHGVRERLRTIISERALGCCRRTRSARGSTGRSAWWHLRGPRRRPWRKPRRRRHGCACVSFVCKCRLDLRSPGSDKSVLEHLPENAPGPWTAPLLGRRSPPNMSGKNESPLLSVLRRKTSKLQLTNNGGGGKGKSFSNGLQSIPR